MKKVLSLILIIITLFVLAACSYNENRDDSLESSEIVLPKGKASYICFEKANLTTEEYTDVEFEFINVNVIKITDKNGIVFYYGASQLYRYVLAEGEE